jgi:hypothetical protein
MPTNVAVQTAKLRSRRSGSKGHTREGIEVIDVPLGKQSDAAMKAFKELASFSNQKALG